MPSRQDTTPASDTPFVTVTQGVRVRVWPSYNEGASKPEGSVFVYTYTIEITNEGKTPVRLISRHWIIRDGFAKTEHVRGPGVVGHQPRLEPGEAFTYTSSCPLPTPSGSMEGSYQMKTDDDRSFEAKIDEFPLVHKGLIH